MFESTPARSEIAAFDIAFCVDGHYLTHAFVVMGSIVETHPCDHFTFWVVIPDADVPAEYEQAASRLGDRASVRFLRPEHRDWRFGVSDRQTATHISEAMYLRLLLPELLPANVSRVLYLDADILATSAGLADLFTLDLQGRPIAAVRDAFTRRFVDTMMLPGLLDHPNLDPQAPYFNSGVLLIDVDAWKSHEVRHRCEAYLHDTAGLRRFPDQDALNVALYQNWVRLSSRYNNMMASRLDNVPGASLSDAVLVHSTGPIKHWLPEFIPGGRTDAYERIRNRLFAGRG